MVIKLLFSYCLNSLTEFGAAINWHRDKSFGSGCYGADPKIWKSSDPGILVRSRNSLDTDTGIWVGFGSEFLNCSDPTPAILVKFVLEHLKQSKHLDPKSYNSVRISCYFFFSIIFYIKFRIPKKYKSCIFTRSDPDPVNFNPDPKLWPGY